MVILVNDRKLHFCKMIKSKVLIGFIVLFSIQMKAHPTGNMIAVGDFVLWSYISPIDDASHHACVMIWKEGTSPKVHVRSAFPGSDYMLSSSDSTVYLIERKFVHSSGNFESRILKLTEDDSPTEIWPWFKDDWRVGEGGFFMLSDSQIVFGRYPEVYTLKKGESPVKYFEFNQPVNGIRAVENNQLLLLTDSSCYLVGQDGTVVKHWDHLINAHVEDAPLDRNKVFDADYKDGELLLAYWGNRSFIWIDESGRRQTVLKQSAPLATHWVAFFKNNMLLFSSELIFDGSTPKPDLVLVNSAGIKSEVWRVR